MVSPPTPRPPNARPLPAPPPTASPVSRAHPQRVPWVALGTSAALVAAVLGVLGDAYHLYWGFGLDADRSDLLEDPLYRAHGIAIAAAYGLSLLLLPALAQGLPKGAKRPLVAGLVLAAIGTVLVAGDYWAESAVTPGVVADQPSLADEDASGLHLATIIAAFAMHAIAWLLVAIGSARGGLPSWMAVLWGLAAVVAFTPLPGSNILLFAMVGVVAGWLRKANRST